MFRYMLEGRHTQNEWLNWAFVTTFVLSLLSPPSIGWAVNTLHGTVQAQMGQVDTLSQDTQADAEITQTLGPDGGSIVVGFLGEPREVAFAPGALLREVDITVSVSATPDTDYPDYPALREIYPPELLNYISPKLTAELPSDALDWQNDDATADLINFDPGVNPGAYDEDMLISAEIRIRMKNGENNLDFANYDLGDYAVLGPVPLRLSYQYGGVPVITSISVQIVDETALYGDLP